MSLRHFRSSLAAAAALSALAATAQIPPPPEPAAPAPAEEMVGPIKLADVDIDTILGALEMYTGRTVLRPQALPTNNYSFKYSKPLPKSDAIIAIETMLSLNGVSVVPLGDKFLKVVALTQAKTEAPEMIEGSTLSLAASGRIATKLFQLEFLRVNEFIPQISPLMSPGVANGIVSLDKANAALITDTVSNLQRVETLIRQLDRPNANGLTPKFYPLSYAKASDLVNRLRMIFQGPLQNQLGSATTFNADDRTNQIVLLADSRQYPLFDDLIAKLDVKGELNTRNEVIYLKHAAAKDVAALLSQLVSGQNSITQKSGANGSVRPGQIQLQGAPGAVAAPATAAPAIGGLVVPSDEFSSLITVLPDERSNAVVVSGTVDDIRLIKDLVEKVDILLAQVRIEVIIAEVTLSDTDRSGINALNLTVGPLQDGRTSITNFSADAAAAGGGIAGWNITSGVVNPLSFNAALGNTGSKSNVKILSAPMIMTTHNKEAEVKVGQQQPIITGSTATPTSASTTGITTQSQVTYKDIAIDLKVTPLIGDDGSIQLKISQEVNDVIGNVVIDGNDQPIIGTRLATSFVNVQDGQMIVLGGLQRTKTDAGRTKLGFLAEIPVISQIFGGRTKTEARTELLLFIRPHVIPVSEAMSDTRKDIDKQMNRQQIDDYLEGKTAKTAKGSKK
ncbi:MAG: type and secretion system protein [Verrucomicrobia bacterium]|nr:type and secretion system protein [Verrucomicrobiota bacterium]